MPWSAVHCRAGDFTAALCSEFSGLEFQQIAQFKQVVDELLVQLSPEHPGQNVRVEQVSAFAV
jgi:hypothetical protein